MPHWTRLDLSTTSSAMPCCRPDWVGSQGRGVWERGQTGDQPRGILVEPPQPPPTVETCTCILRRYDGLPYLCEYEYVARYSDGFGVRRAHIFRWCENSRDYEYDVLHVHETGPWTGLDTRVSHTHTHTPPRQSATVMAICNTPTHRQRGGDAWPISSTMSAVQGSAARDRVAAGREPASGRAPLPSRGLPRGRRLQLNPSGLGRALLWLPTDEGQALSCNAPGAADVVTKEASKGARHPAPSQQILCTYGTRLR